MKDFNEKALIKIKKSGIFFNEVFVNLYQLNFYDMAHLSYDKITRVIKIELGNGVDLKYSGNRLAFSRRDNAASLTIRLLKSKNHLYDIAGYYVDNGFSVEDNLVLIYLDKRINLTRFRKKTVNRSLLFEQPSITLPLLDLKELERQAILIALKQCHCNQALASELLGITARVLNYKINFVHEIGDEDKED